MRTAPLLALLAALSTSCKKPKPLPPEPPPPPSVADPESAGGRAFVRLTELEGSWAIVGSDVPASFEKVGRGNAVAQHSGFYAVWYPDGSRLSATLFPDDGYHATMRSTKIEEMPGGALVIEMVADQVGNLPPEAPLPRSVTLTLVPGGQQVTQRWVFRAADGDKPVELVLDRKAAAQAPPADAAAPDMPAIDPTKVIFPH